MSFSISVHRVEDEPSPVPVPDSQDDEAGWQAFNAWMEGMWKISTYWPLGGDHTVYTFWSSTAAELDLPLLTALYNEGLTAQGPEQLSQLEWELDALQGYWDTHELCDPDPRSGLHGREREELQERMGYLREAISVARETGGVLGIS